MLSSEQYFQAKSFLRLYKDSLTCMEQVARKKSHIQYQADFYDHLQEAYKKKQLEFTEGGNLQPGKDIRSSYFYRVFGLIE